MVQAPDITMGHQDLPQALVLLSEMNVSAQHVATLVDKMLERVRNGELTTDQGLSFLEMKYNMLLSYLINLTYVVLRKCSGKKIEDDPCIDRLIEIRTVLEKIRPIDNKLKYQIDKLVKTAVTGTDANDPTSFKANPEDLLGKDEESSKEEEDDYEGKQKEKTDVYVPPKLSAVHYTGDETAFDRNKRIQEKKIKRLIIQESRHDLDIPIEVRQGNRAEQKISEQQLKRELYEEENFVRLPIRKADKHDRRKYTTVGTLGDEFTDLGTSSSSKNKRKRSGGGKKKDTKRKRFR